MTLRRAAVVGAAAVALSVAGLLLASRSAYRPSWLGPALLFTTVAVSFVLAGLVAAVRRPENRTGTTLVVTGFTWFLGLLAIFDNDVLFTAGVLLGPLPYALVAALALGYPTGTLPWRPDRVIVGAAIALVTVGQLLFMFIATDAEICPTSIECGTNLLFLTDERVPTLVIRWSLNVAIAATVGAALWRMALRWRHASGALRRVVGPVYLGAAIAFASVAVRVVLADVSEGGAAALWAVQVAALLGVPLAILLGLLRSRLARGAVAALTVALGSEKPLREALAEALGDPTLTIAYPLSGEGWVDAEGRPTILPSDGDDRTGTPVHRAGRVVATLVHDRALADEPELVDGVAAAAALALRAEGLQAEARAQYTFLETLVNTAPSLIVHIDTDGRIRNQSAFATEVAGHDDEEEIRGRLFWDVFIDPGERQQVIERFEAARPGFTYGEYENTFTNVRGERRVVSWRAAPVVADDGRVTGIIAAGVDITARHEEAEARERERAFLNAIANEAPSLLCLIDENGVMAPAAANRAFESRLELGSDSVGGEVFWERYVAPEHAADVERTIRLVAAGERVPERDDVWLTASGVRLDVAWTCTALPRLDERRLFLVSGLDVTERRRREEEVRAQRDFLIAVSRATPSFLAVVGEDCRVDHDLGVNKAMWEIGYPDERAKGSRFWELVAPPDERERFREDLLASFADEVPRQRESTWVTGDGRRLAVSWSARPMFTGAAGSCWLICGTDITERRERELEVERERDATTTVLQSIPSIVIVLDRQGRIRDRDVDNPLAAVNRAFRETFGWRDAELVGREVLELIDGEHEVESARAAIAAAASGVNSGEVESRWRCADGSLRLFSWSAAPVPDVTGRTEGLVLLSGVDITERRQRELEHQRRQEFIEAIGEASPSYIVIVTGEGIVRAGGSNAAFEQAFGWTSEEIAGKPFVGTVTPSTDYAARMMIANAANGAIQGEVESRWESRDGGSLIVAWSARPVTGVAGEPLVLVSGVDVTERRLQAEELRASRTRIVSAADEARRRLERDLHDGAQQRLVALSVSLRLAEARALNGGDDVPELLRGLRAELGVALEELRELARGIHPAILTDRGLGPALDALVARAPLSVELSYPDVSLPTAVEAAAYFVAAEALTNVAKYAGARQARVGVTLGERCLLVEIADDGVGGADASRGSGLRGLADRVAALDGRLSLESPAGGGTIVRAEIPVDVS
jgi:PAS domain S-box-containing protein